MSTSLGSLLIVDDEAELVSALCEMLTEHAYETVGVTSGHAALQLLSEKDFDLLLTDLMMPEMDGTALLQAALDTDPQLVGIIMTGQGTVKTAVGAMKIGAFDYVLKPFKLNTLLPVLARAMQLRRLSLENLQLRETLAIHELIQTIASTFTLETVLEKVAQSAAQQCDAAQVIIWLPEAAGNQLYVAAVWGERLEQQLGNYVPMGDTDEGWVAEHRVPRLTDRSVWMPILSRGKLEGVLQIHAAQRRRPFSSGDMKALNLLMSIAGPVLENAQLVATLEKRVSERTVQLEAANQELEAFSYSVSHDLRAPLRAIDGFSRMLLRDYQALLPADGQDLLQAVRENTQQMARLIDDLLAFSRLSRQSLNKEPVVLATLVQRVLRDLSADQEGRQVEIVLGDLPTCQSDPRLLQQVFVNLLSNAFKYTRHRDVARIEVGCRVQNGGTVYFVKDNGAGFDMRYADKLFGVFQRLHRAEEFEGTGVGLAIVQRIIHRHGGRIWAEAEVDKGATFYFTLEGEGLYGGE